MELPAVWDELVRLAGRLAVEVREERLEPLLDGRDHGRGGLCVVRGRRVVLVDERAPLRDRVATLAIALGRFDLETVHVSPLVRATIERGGRLAAPRAPAANEPGLRVPPPAGASWVRVGTAAPANRNDPPPARSGGDGSSGASRGRAQPDRETNRNDEPGGRSR